jgi:hypothetical protein
MSRTFNDTLPNYMASAAAHANYTFEATDSLSIAAWVKLTDTLHASIILMSREAAGH